MTNRSEPHWLWAQLDDLLAGDFPPFERTLFPARLVAWHILNQRFNLPEHLRPRIATELSGEEVIDAWRALANLEELGGLRYAFTSLLEDPHCHISDAALTELNELLSAARNWDQSRCELFAATAVERLSNDADADDTFGSLPFEISDFMLQLIELGVDERFVGFGKGYWDDAFSLSAMRGGLKPTVINRWPPISAALYAAIAGHDVKVIIADPYRHPSLGESSDTTFDCGAIEPKFGKLRKELRLATKYRLLSSEAFGIEVGLRCVRDKLAVVVPNSFLFASGPDGEFRKHLVREGILRSVISFPSGLLRGTSIPFSILLLTPSTKSFTITLCKVDESHLTGQGKVRTHDRRFIKGEQVLHLVQKPDRESAIEVSEAEVREQGFNLTVERYLSRPFETLRDAPCPVVSLEELVDIVKPQFLPADDGPGGVEIREAIPSDIPRYDYLTSVERIRQVDAAALASKAKQILADDDILLSTKGTIGTVGLARPDPNSSIPLLPSQASVILRLKNDGYIQDARYLATYLRSPAVQQALGALATGGTIANISLNDLRALPVWVPSIEEQERMVKVFDQQAEIERRIAEMAGEQKQIANKLWRDLGLSVSRDEPREN